MHIRDVRPVIVANAGLVDRCLQCGARRHSVCAVIVAPDLPRLAAASTVRNAERGATFIEEGEPATDFFNITSGSAKLYKLLPDGRQQITGFAAAGHFLGLANTGTYAFSAEALEPVQMCRFSRPHLRALIDDFPAIEQHLLETACNELAAAQEQMLLLGRKTARERVASFLLARCLEGAPCDETAAIIHLPMTRGEIADYLGLTIETVSRTFTQFRTAQRIATPSKSEVVLLDRAWLEALAAGLS